MADLHSFGERFYYGNRREYTHQDGNIAYLDGAPLKRPFSMPRTQRLIAFVIVVIAIALGALFINNTILASIRETAEAESIVAANLERTASIESIPAMVQVVNMSNDDLRAALGGSGYTVYDASDPADPNSLLLYRIPDDMTLDEAAGLYAKGVSSLSAIQASKLLNGSWYFSTDRDGINTAIVRYADFSTGDTQKAIQAALQKQAFDPNTITEEGEDESGNTYCMGTIDAGGTVCSWKISALPLADMYDISGLPEDACYVGIRITAM